MTGEGTWKLEPTGHIYFFCLLDLLGPGLLYTASMLWWKCCCVHPVLWFMMGSSGCMVTWCCMVMFSVSKTRPVASHELLFKGRIFVIRGGYGLTKLLEVCAVVLLQLASSYIQNLSLQQIFLISFGLGGPRAQVSEQLLLKPGGLSSTCPTQKSYHYKLSNEWVRAVCSNIA